MEYESLDLLLVDNQPVRQALCVRYEQTMARVKCIVARITKLTTIIFSISLLLSGD